MTAADEVRKVYDEDLRLVLLRLLKEYGAALNTSTLEKSLRAWGFRAIDRSTVATHCRWLSHQGLVDVEELRSDVLMVALKPKGARVAAGDEWIDGVAQPS